MAKGLRIYPAALPVVQIGNEMRSDDLCIPYTYVLGYSRRRGWRTQSLAQFGILTDCDGDFVLASYAVYVTGHKAQVRRYTRTADVRIEWGGHFVTTKPNFIVGGPHPAEPHVLCRAGSLLQFTFMQDESERFKLAKRLEIDVWLSGWKRFDSCPVSVPSKWPKGDLSFEDLPGSTPVVQSGSES